MRVCLLISAALLALSDTTSGNDFSKKIEPVFREHCTRCHGEKDKVKGKVNLLEIRDFSRLKADPDFLRDLIDVIEFEEMPPEEEPQPDAATRKQLVASLQTALHEAVLAKKSFEQAPIRRMNRFQYNNAVQDLFGLKVNVFSLPERMMRDHGNYFQPASGEMPPTVKVGSRPLGKSQLIEPRLLGVAAFPQDLRAEHGFDNRGDHLSLSPMLMEEFLKVSRSIMESQDFTEKNVSTWGEFFAPPAPGIEIDPSVLIEQRLEPFLSRAFRRPVDEKTLNRYTEAVVSQINSGDSWENSMKAAASAAIASPRFLYLYDAANREPKSVAEPLDDFELASRLSFFLWGSLPDETLLDLAKSGTLSDPEILAGQVDRMLNDRKLKRFCDSFPGQWLQLENIVSAVPDPKTYPNFYFAKYRASLHMMLEPLLLFETVLLENRPVTELIDPDFSYRSRELVSWYAEGKLDKARPVVLDFTRVPITDRREGGVITNAAMLTMNSGPSRTKPITRGAWVLTAIFNDPPEPPPADVPPLPEEDPDFDKLTLREQLKLHRENASCQGCHEKIDPLGFALENYDPTGLWRETYPNGREVDAAGTLFRKHEFTNPVEFKDAILKEKERFVQGFTAHLLSFALGREPGAADRIAIDRIVEESAAEEYRMRDLIRRIVLSEPFLYKTNPKLSLSTP
ncbi:MAG: DUF1592 domain-containing protein [Verrucomicrobiales bacterium]|nr:DUF1592 domain-containing protein [Verrucomicrobiales bacterium]